MRVVNRRAYYDYHLLEKIEAGIELTGPEVKSIKKGRIKLEQAFVRINEGQIFLVNAHVSPYEFAAQTDYDPSRQRRLLLQKKQILALETKARQKKLTLIPLSCYTQGSWIKLEIALAKGKKKFEKKEVKKRRDIDRETEKELRG